MSEDNEVFVYPELTGRCRIYTDAAKITSENIFQVLEEAMMSDLSDQTGNSPILDGMNTDNGGDEDVHES